MPSIVLIEQPWTWATGTRQLLTSRPSIRTLHAPHSPSPQPSLVPVRFNCARNTSSRRSMGKASTVRGWPLTSQVIFTSSNIYANNSSRRGCENGSDQIHCELKGYHVVGGWSLTMPARNGDRVVIVIEGLHQPAGLSSSADFDGGRRQHSVTDIL